MSGKRRRGRGLLVAGALLVLGLWPADGRSRAAEPAAPSPAPAGAAAPVHSPRQQAILDVLTAPMLQAWDVPDGLERFVPAPVNPENAAVHFRNLDGLYAADKSAGRNPGVRDDAAGIAEYLAAGRSARCAFVPDVYPAFTAGDVQQPDYIVLFAYGRAVLARAEQLSRDGRSQEAEEHFHALLNAARHLTLQSPSFIVYLAGLSTKLSGATRYARFLRDHRRHDESRVVEEYTRTLRDRYTLMDRKLKLCLGEFQNFNSLPATLRIAFEDGSLFWRQEAVIRLGVLRHGAPNAFRAADAGAADAERIFLDRDPALEQQALAALVRIRDQDPVPSMRGLAAWAIGTLTPERYVEMRLKQFEGATVRGEP